MKRILHASARAVGVIAAIWIASLAPTGHSSAYAQRTIMRGQTVVYYDGYGQGYYGGYAPSYGGAYMLVPNNNRYLGYGNGPYGTYPGYGNPGYYYPYNYGRTFGGTPYQVSPAFGY
jgi:hypothetical protein